MNVPMCTYSHMLHMLINGQKLRKFWAVQLQPFYKERRDDYRRNICMYISLSYIYVYGFKLFCNMQYAT